MNCQSINAKFDELKIKLHQWKSINCEFNAICLQETWLLENADTSLLQLDNYTLISRGKTCSLHGGLLIYLRNDYKYANILTNTKSDIWEGQFINVSNELTKEKIIIGNIYRPPVDLNENYQLFTDEFTFILNQLQKGKREVIILGDFNIDLLKTTTKPKIKEYLDSVMAHSFFPKITFPTRFSEQNGTLIDNALYKLSKHFFNATAGILIAKLSDHLPYFVCIENKLKIQTVPKYIYIKDNNEATVQNFKTALNKANIFDKLNTHHTANPCDNYNILHNTISEIQDICMPLKKVKFNKHCHKKSQWITQGIIKSINFRDKLYLSLKQTPYNTPKYAIIKTNLKTYNKILRHNIELAKRLYYTRKFNKSINDMKKTWDIIKQITNRMTTKKQLPSFFNLNGQIITGKHNIANKFNEYFTKIGPTLAANIKTYPNKTHHAFLTAPTENRLHFKQINEADVIKLLQQLPSKTSCGKDGMSTNLIKSIQDEISKPLTLIINQCLRNGIFPNKLKLAKVIPIHKKDNDTDFANYRPISILPALSKIFERVIYNQTHDYFQSNNLYFNSQYGFRKQHSTELALLEVIDRITLQLDNKITPINIFLDLSKAFDTLDHNILLEKLKHYGIHDTALALFESYLSNRQQYVEYNGTESTLEYITTGVPQGSILGPLLFIIYINDIAQSSRKFDFITYADDTTLCSTLDGVTAVADINTALKNITEWLEINKLSLNVKKTKAMVFHMPQKQIIPPNLKINDTTIEFVDNFVFLGVTINKHLNWSNHVDKTANKISKTIGMLNNLKKTLPSNILRILYNSLILPHLNYGILAWGRKIKRLKNRNHTKKGSANTSSQ